MKKWLVAVGMVAAMGVLAGCSSGPKSIKVEVKNMAFSTKQITLKAGVPVQLTLVNNDTITHDLSVDTIPVDVTAATENAEGHTHGEGKEPDLHVSAGAGGKGWVQFTPTEPGTYTFYCTVAGHRTAGMEGQLIVK